MNTNTILERGVSEITVKSDLEKKLRSGKKLRVKYGIDPTGSELHLGHSVVLKKLRQFQDRGDQTILVIGDYTARIGDPSGKSETRKMLTEEEIQENMKNYVEQASKILDVDKLEVRYNSEWFSKMTMAKILELTAKKTVNQMLQREDFKNRIKNAQEITITELLYPLMQGYDSVALEADIELGGTDQTFNLLVGRDLQKAFGCKVVQDIITCPILEGTDGVEKMSKSLGNYIGINEPPSEIFGKTMSIPDNMIMKYFELTTDVQNLKEIKESLENGENPRNLKVRLAKELVKFYHSDVLASEAEEEFVNMFQKKGLPDVIEEKKLKQSKWKLVDLLAETGMVASKSEARRMIGQGGVKVDQEKVSSVDAELDISEEKLLQVGKRKWLKIKA